jgi:hypothetical protein
VWFKSRRNALIAEITAAVIDALEKRHPAASATPIDAIGKFYADSLGGMSAFMTNAGELALRGAMSAMGQRGGRAKAKKRAERLALGAATPRSCALCLDPQYRGVTVQMIQEHRRHEGNGHRSTETASEAPSGPEPAQGA